jgi:hypothetical protein
MLFVASPAWAAESTVALKEVFQGHFPIGTAVNRSMMMGGAGFRRSADLNTQDVALLKHHFNQITAENDMKWQLIHPREGAEGYDFGPADALVNFGLKHQMQVVGHTLVWHSQTPNWVFAGTNPPPDSATNATTGPQAPAPARTNPGRAGPVRASGAASDATMAHAHPAMNCSSACATTSTPSSVATRARSRSGTS